MPTTPSARARWLTWLAYGYVAAQFLPWWRTTGGFRHFFWGGSFNTGWSSGFFDAVILLPFAIAAALRLQRAFPRARLAIAELALALGFVTVVRIALPYISGNTFFGHPRPAIGAVVGVVLATALIVLARIDRGASER